MPDGLDRYIWELGFPAWNDIAGRRSVAGLVGDRQRGGVYMLGFLNGERYVGRASDVVKRFAQHRLVHPDLAQFTFKPVRRADVADEERRCIHILEARGMPLRNLAEMSVVTGERMFDKVVTPDDQQRWLDCDPTLIDDPRGEVDKDLRRRYQRRFETYKSLELARDASLLLGAYLQAAIPLPNRTELTFWSMSCLPNGSAYSRVNLNMQEVFTVTEYAGELATTFHLAKSPFERELGPTWQSQLEEWGWPFDLHYWKPGGGDQFQLFADFELSIFFLLHPLAQEAMSLLNLRLMRKGPTYYGPSHCIDLVTDAHSAYEQRSVEIDALRDKFLTVDTHEDA